MLTIPKNKKANSKAMKSIFFKTFILAGTILISQISLIAQQRDIEGVVDDGASPLGGVTVMVKGTADETSTDNEGKFQIQAEEGQVLVFRMVGFVTNEHVVDSNKKIKISLEENQTGLEEVLVVGYGSQSKKDVTGSVSQVEMANLEEQSVTSFDQSLSGQVPGVIVNTSNGIPGGGPKIQVRGIGAVGAGSEPLYVIDGFPIPSSSSQHSNPISSINPQDIESITVLKDASATAIYGSRGANGVVMVTTKRGKSGKPSISFEMYSGMQQVPQKGRPELMNGQEFAQFRKEAIEDKIRFEEGREPTADDIPQVYRDPSAIGQGTDWYDAVTRTAPLTNIGLSINGGSDKLRSLVSLNYLDHKGVMLNTDFKRYSLRANLEADFNDRLKVGFNLAPSISYVNGGVRGQGRDEGFEIVNPIPEIYNDDGSYNAYIESPGTFGIPNPVMALSETTNQYSRSKVLFTTFGEFEIIENLKFKSSFNADLEESKSEYFRPSIIGDQNSPPPSIPSGSYGSSRYINWLNENTLSYDYDSGTGHVLSALGGYSIQFQRNEGGNFTGQQFPDDDIKTLNAAAKIIGDTDKTDWALISYLARLNYSFQDEYLITATIRSDGSSRFGPENRWGTFPSLAVGWRLTEASFLKNPEWLDELKLRASYGFTGNFNIGNYSYMSNIGTRDYIFNGVLASGRAMNTLGNPYLGWEKMREFNLGLDLNLINNRIRLVADFYNRNTQDLLLNVEIPHSSGFGTVTENRGDVQNRGFELGLATTNITTENFDWSTNLNFTLNRNKVLSLGRSEDPIYSGESSEGNPTNVTKIGSPVGMIIGYVYEGIYQNEEEIEEYPSFPGAVPGNMRFKDVNGDGEITPFQDFDVIGNPYPDFAWSVTNSLSYKDFDFRMLIVGSVGAEMLRATNFYTGNLDGVFNVNKEIKNRWRSPENPGNGKIPTTDGTGRGRVMYRDSHSLWVEKTDYAWVKNITLGYTFSNLNKLINSFRIYGTIQNAFLFTNYGGNPEGTNHNRPDTGALVPGIDYSNYPVPRIYTLGVNLNL